MKKHNIIWIYVDSVRRYHSTIEAIKAGDDRSRLEFMDEFAKESVEFINTVTSAPSTQMSVSAMAASLPSYYLASNFGDYFTGNYVVDINTNTLRENGYNIYGFLQSKRSREFNQNVFTTIKGKYWPKGFSHLDYWDNSDINTVIDNALKHNLEKPAFFFVNFNCRKDSDTSDKVKWALERFRSAGFTQENTITVLCSDHGYPDPNKETGKPEFYINHNKKSDIKISHDLVLTDDNIMIPLFIQYPDCLKGLRVNETVSSLDIFPTILDILELPAQDNVVGKSLLSLMNKKLKFQYLDRFFRTDSRLKRQAGRGTSIRNNSWKYIYYHDNLRGNGDEEFFDIVKDPQEKFNLIRSNDSLVKKQIAVFRNEFKKSEKEAIEYHNKQYITQLMCSKPWIFSSSNTLVVDNIKNGLAEIFIDNNKNKSRDIELITGSNINHQIDHSKGNIKEYVFIDNLEYLLNFANKREYDLLVLFTKNNEADKYKKKIETMKDFRFNNILILDPNSISVKKNFFYKAKREILFTLPFLKHEPLYFFKLLMQKIKKVF
tara:strand:+ start:211 stop:1848 length:1638 start_codon:yes stop_codon:yes gene_type:complete